MTDNEQHAHERRAITQITVERGGATFDRFGRLVEPEGGYAVAIANGMSVPEHGIESGFRAVRDTWKGAPYIGTWKEDALFYAIDPVVIIHDAIAALTVAKACDQKAIYDFRNARVIEL